MSRRDQFDLKRLMPRSGPGGSTYNGHPAGFRGVAVFYRVLALLCEALAKGSRRDADQPTELLGEVTGAREAHLLGHHAHGQVGVRE